MNSLTFVLIFLVGVYLGGILSDALLLPYVGGKKVLYSFLNGLGYAVLFMRKGALIETIVYCIMVSLLLIISIIDYHFKRIPDKFNLALLFLGIIYACIDYKNFASHLNGFFCVVFFFIFLFFISHRMCMGGGDVKLLAACGCILGGEMIFMGFYMGCVFALLCEVLSGNVKKQKKEIAMGPYFTMGILLSILRGW